MIIRVTKSDDPFARVPKSMLNDKRLSWRAKGILAYLLGKPNDWVVQVNDVLNHCPEGRDAVRAAFRELRDCGYAFMVNTPFGREWHVADVARPCPENPSMEPCPEKAMLAKSATTKNEGNKETKKEVPLAIGGQNEEHMKRMLAHAKSRPHSEQMVVAFCKSIGLPEADGEYYWAHWEGNGFKNNKVAMRDWQSVIRSHKIAGHCPSQKQRGNGNVASKPLSTYDINTRIKAIEDELGKTEYDKDKPEVAQRRKELWAKRKALKAKLLE